jgi:hypothetical protein
MHTQCYDKVKKFERYSVEQGIPGKVSRKGRLIRGHEIDAAVNKACAYRPNGAKTSLLN